MAGRRRRGGAVNTLTNDEHLSRHPRRLSALLACDFQPLQRALRPLCASSRCAAPSGAPAPARRPTPGRASRALRITSGNLQGDAVAGTITSTSTGSCARARAATAATDVCGHTRTTRIGRTRSTQNVPIVASVASSSTEATKKIYANVQRGVRYPSLCRRVRVLRGPQRGGVLAEQVHRPPEVVRDDDVDR